MANMLYRGSRKVCISALNHSVHSTQIPAPLHSWQLYCLRPCSQMLAPLQNLHSALRRPCSQKEEPLHSLHCSFLRKRRETSHPQSRGPAARRDEGGGEGGALGARPWGAQTSRFPCGLQYAAPPHSLHRVGLSLCSHSLAHGRKITHSSDAKNEEWLHRPPAEGAQGGRRQAAGVQGGRGQGVCEGVRGAGGHPIFPFQYRVSRTGCVSGALPLRGVKL